MVDVKGVGGIPEPQPQRSASVRERRNEETRSRGPAPQDGVQISSEAQEAASVAQAVQLGNETPDIRQERVDEARAALERGDYKLPNLIAEVARKLSELL
ncbi:MAG: hypothetical protein AMXMBFR84_30760 [Candidatus Hydrogenedentota bacterium]